MNKALLIGLTPPLEGGSEMHIYEISKRINCDVLTQRGSSCKNRIELSIIKSPQIAKSFSFLLSSFIYSLYLLFKIKKEYDIVHIHENLLYFLAPLLRIRYKVVVTIHGIKGFKFYDNKKLWFFFRQGLKFANFLIAVNVEDKNKLEIYFKKVVYIPNGVDLSLYGKLNAKVEKKITFVGRIHEQKGIIYLLEAFNMIKDKLPGFKLEIIGKIDDYGNELKKKFNDKRILWRGFISDRKEIVKSLKSAYCIVLPSLWEGLPLTLFESLASGRPLLISDIDAFKSVVKDEALFFKVKNSSDLASKMIVVTSSNRLAEDYSRKGKKLSEKYDWKVISKKLGGEYEKIR